MVSVYSVMLESMCVAHHPVFTVSILVSSWHVLTDIDNYGMSVHNQLGLKGGTISDDQAGAHGTHTEDNKDPASKWQSSPYRSSHEKLRGYVSPTLVDDLVLGCCDMSCNRERGR